MVYMYHSFLKMLNITHYQRNANQNHNEVPLLSFFKVLILLLYFTYLFLAVLSLSLCPGFLYFQQVGAALLCGVRASHGGVCSFCGTQAQDMRASVVTAHGLSSCGSQISSTGSVVE